MTESPSTLNRIEEELRQAMAAKKCWRCGCFQDTIDTLQDSAVIQADLASLLKEARTLFEPKRYDCLGCEVCWPAVAQNLAAELDPAVAEGGHCATEAPELREGWPPLPGDYQVVRMQAPVAVCTLNSDHLVAELVASGVEDLSLVGTLHTENLGIEHLIRNTLANPHIRFLVLCGEDTQKAIGHLPGQSLISLFHHGVNEKMRIIGANGKRPLLKNLDVKHVEAFRRQVQLVECIGKTDIPTVLKKISEAAANNPGPFAGAPEDILPIPIEAAAAPTKLTLDPAGYFVVYPDRRANQLMLEHYTNQGVLDRMFAAQSPAALYVTVINEGLISRLDHAAYLGRELARAEQALKSGEKYVQDQAPGEIEQASLQTCSSGCGCR
ncbi:tetrahydromethanopterin S-methyltransferase subunit A [Candidatus Tenderia electrophaga]|jgi:tetrahydromethanopterin S-methyltransferase subunit A|uniref:Tetrahydromethanopterin S-methyltransferase subunit A n=1 Tax=Candidatus Tenderia electrophaga TaxID=1748243 RepID=A0A0S2TEW1_9GAMM|nr:tetrahydromethanopterin S-methyltransferase subunit A [Candidatus Tenderia electrophaga]